jgi:hypothetical protein
MQNLLAINDINAKINAKATQLQQTPQTQQTQQTQQTPQTNDSYEVIAVQLMRSRL